MARGSRALARSIWTLVLLVAVLASALAAPPARAAERDCSDFDNQAQAQGYFLDRGGPDSDPDLLDGDGDGVACDSLPCPCSRRRARPSPQPRATPRPRAQTIRARVTAVIDGDTIRVKPLGATRRPRYTVRLIGIDTPEVYGGIECGGRQASAHMKRLASGRRVLLRTDPTQDTFDRYDRLLAYAKLRGGPDAAFSQLRTGRAKVYVYGGEPFQRVRSFRRAQQSARQSAQGVWGACDGNFHRVASPSATGERLARASACGSVSYGGGGYVLYYRGMSCASARRRVRHVHRHHRLRGWRCSSGSNFATGGYCSRGHRHFGWHPGD